jgi:hypothetical protein
LLLGAQPLSTYNGFLCDEDHEDSVIDALASYIKNHLAWDEFHMNGMVDKRLFSFAKKFSSDKFYVHQSSGLPSLRISLPNSWDIYEKEFVGKRTRKTLHKSSNRVTANPNFKITHLGPDTAERDIDIALAMWQNRYGKKLSASLQRKMLIHLFHQKKLWLNILWDGQKPVSTELGIIDEENKTFVAYLTGYDSNYARISPGMLIQLDSIRKAIETGAIYYDFLLGDDQYKRSLGATEREVKIVIVKRRLFKAIAASSVYRITSFIKKPVKRLLRLLKP